MFFASDSLPSASPPSIATLSIPTTDITLLTTAQIIIPFGRGRITIVIVAVIITSSQLSDKRSVDENRTTHCLSHFHVLINLIIRVGPSTAAIIRVII